MVHPSQAPAGVFLARQPVLDLRRRIVGFELLYRGSAGAQQAGRGGAHATSRVLLNTFAEFGIREVTGNGMCFVNLTGEFLAGELPLPMDPGSAVLEIVPSVAVDEELIAGVLDLVDRGFAIAIDGYDGSGGRDVLLSVARYVKINIGLPEELLHAAVGRCRRYPGVQLIAERVETARQVRLAKLYGFSLLQGYGLGKPELLAKASPAVPRTQLLAAFGAVHGTPDAARPALERGAEQQISRQLARATGTAPNTGSLQEAVAALGIGPVRQWLTLMLLADVTAESDAELHEALARAQLCRMVAARLGEDDAGAYAVGLLSGTARLLRQPVAALIEHTGQPEAIHLGLTSKHSPLGRVLDLVEAFERHGAELFGTAMGDAAAPGAEAVLAGAIG